jgi:hypothetical protein
MVTLNPQHQHLLASASGLSFRDRATISLMYECGGSCNRNLYFHCNPVPSFYVMLNSWSSLNEPDSRRFVGIQHAIRGKKIWDSDCITNI